MKPFYTHPPERTLTETAKAVTYRGRWFIDNQVVVLYVRSAGPLSKMMLGNSPDTAAHQLFHEFPANEVTRRRVQEATEVAGQLNGQKASRDCCEAPKDGR